jgi:membrane-associated HD superfamily phosphohydrolase
MNDTLVIFFPMTCCRAVGALVTSIICWSVLLLVSYSVFFASHGHNPVADAINQGFVFAGWAAGVVAMLLFALVTAIWQHLDCSCKLKRE